MISFSRKASLKKSWRYFSGILLIMLSGVALSQTLSSYPSATGSPPGVSIPSAQGPFGGSVPPNERPTAETLSITFKDAIDRGLQNNLGVLLQSDNTVAARGQKWSELSNLLPNLSAGVSESAAQINLVTFGFRFTNPAFAGIPTVVGPFGYFDSRFYLTQNVFSWKDIQRVRGASSNEKAARYSYQDARDLVVLAVGNAYLQALAGEARVQTAEAQVQTAQALYDKSVDQQNAGVVPAIDTLRSHVELQTRQQQLIVVRNDFAKEKLALARAIGLAPGQAFSMADKAPYAPLTALGVDESLKRAYMSRSDYQAAQQQVRAAQLFRNAATAGYYPTVDVAANYGDSGTTIGNSHGVFQVTGTLRIPIFAGGKVHSDVLEAEADLKQSEQQLANLRGQIDYDVRTALLDLNAAADQVEVARSSVDLANQTLTQARDRFAAGVTDNLEVIQAQESVASANENYISSLYAHNLAKVELARAIGYAEDGVKQFLKSK
ncbi:MAG TPA: TolC family protein [Terriglobales bacterium]|nr:TolC family protein [Terriglobales bacterium]